MRWSLPCVVALCSLAQEQAFRSQSRIVLVPATITDSKGRTVEGLTAGDLVLLDNGRPQQIKVDSFATGVAPIALVVAVQSSGISIPVLEKVRKVGSMIQPLITGERGCAGLVSFAERIDWIQECTGDADAIDRAFKRLKAGEEKKARSLDAVYEVTRKLSTRSNYRRVLLLIAESRDRGSETGLDSAIIAAQTAGLTIYTFTYSPLKTAFTTKPEQADIPDVQDSRRTPNGSQTGPMIHGGPVTLPSPEQRVDILGGIEELVRLGKVKTTAVLANSTGGMTKSFVRLKGLEESIAKLGEELHGQYLLSFTPDSKDPGFHQLVLRIRDRPGLRARWRPGYWPALLVEN